MNENLKQAADVWKNKKDYKRAAMPEVLALNKEYRAAYPDKYPYNADIFAFIVGRCGVAPELEEMLKTEIYLSQHDFENEKKALNAAAMLAAGWMVLDKPAIDKALSSGKLLQVVGAADNDLMMTVKIDQIYKPHIFAKGTDREQYGLMKPKARTRGYTLHQFGDDAFCRLV